MLSIMAFYNLTTNFKRVIEMKKILSVLLALALLISLCACGNDNSGDSSKDENSSAQTETSSIAPNTTKPPMTNLPSTVYPEDAETEKAHFETFTDDPYTHQLVRYELNKECKGYYATPKAKGSYPTVVIMHGQGTVEKFKTRLLSHINNWVKQGYLPPMVVVIPEIMDYTGADDSNMQDFEYYISSHYPKRFNALLTSIEQGTLSSQIGTDKPIYVTGFSMGGMAAVHAGAEYNSRLKYVGGLSPARAFYLGEDNIGFYKKKADIYFSQEPDAHVYLAAGRGEQNQEFLDTINRYALAIKVNNPTIVTKCVAPPTWGGHSWELAQRELFMYLYFATVGQVPSLEYAASICNNPDEYTAPKVVYKEEEHT